MAKDATRQPLLSGLADPVPQANKGCTPKRRRLHYSRSTPHEFVPSDAHRNDTVTQPKPDFVNVSPKFRRAALYLAVYLGIGTICFSLVSNEISGNKTNGMVDAVYFCIVTMTTVGYGDLVPSSVHSKLLACAFVFSGMVLIGHVLSQAADYLVEKQEVILVKALHMHQKLGPNEIIKEVQSNLVKYKCVMTFILLVILIASGVTFLVTVENLDFVDALYCVCSTITTLGYGDESFQTRTGRIFAIFWILASTICLAQFLLYIAELNTENRQKALVKYVLCRKTTTEDLEAADLDEDGTVGGRGLTVLVFNYRSLFGTITRLFVFSTKWKATESTARPVHNTHTVVRTWIYYQFTQCSNQLS